jgi:hypothetical protein
MEEIKRAGGRVLFGWKRCWTVTGYSDATPKSLIMRTFRNYADAHDYYYQLRQRADIINVYGPNGEWLMHWSRYETED